MFSDAVIRCCSSIKILFNLPLRQTVGRVASLLRLAGLNWPVPELYAPRRMQKTLAVQVPYRPAGEPLTLLAESKEDADSNAACGTFSGS